MKRERLPAEQRRRAILAAVTGAFAQNGFEGTTTRALATAAGISEALIYKHFPSKESLYGAMLEECIKGPVFAEFKLLLGLAPSTATLVRMVQFMIAHHVDRGDGDPATTAIHSFMARSLLDDGEFARLTHRTFARAWIAQFQACLAAAHERGDLGALPERPDLHVWFVHHLAFSLMLHLRPKVPVIRYRTSKAELIARAVSFSLMGMGFSSAVVARHYRIPGAAGGAVRRSRSTRSRLGEPAT